MDIQEFISRGRFIFSGAPKRLQVFSFVNGRRSTKEIARQTGKSINATLNDLKKMTDIELVRPKNKKKSNGDIVKKGPIIYEKMPLARTIPLSYFRDTTKLHKGPTHERVKKAAKHRAVSSLKVPSEQEILDICNHGEGQLYEFKAPGVEIKKLTKEIAGFLNTKSGGLLFYGVEDDGTIVGSDITMQKLDQSLHNSVRNTIAPAATIDIKKRMAMGYEILVIVTPPWDRKNVYQYDDRVYLRKGTNVFVAKPEETKKLYSGAPVI